MNSLEVPGEKELIHIPGEWNELDQKTLFKILKLSIQMNAGIIDQDTMITMSFYAIANIKRNWRSVFKEKMLSKNERHLKFANTYLVAKQLTEFLFLPEEPGKPVEINFDTVINFIPSFKDRSGTLYYGPGDLLNDLTFGEFLEALNNMNEYFSSKNERFLDLFISALYRPEGLHRKRSALDDHYRVHAKGISKVPGHIKLGILLWFTTCVKYIKKEDLIINGQLINLKVLFPSGSGGGKGSSGLGWTSLLYGIAKEGLFGDIRDTYKSKLFDVLLFMYDNHYKQLQLNSKK